jgi:repressor of nif and glnA expression
MNRTADISRRILDLLAESCDPIDEAVMNHLLNARFTPAVDFTELEIALRSLSERKLVGRNDRLAGPSWFITGRGRAELYA